MGDFKTINTQEEFDAAIGERLARERETLAKKHSDYDALKEQNKKLVDEATGFQTKITELSNQLEKNKEELANHSKVVSDLNAKIKAYETDSVKTRIALEKGLPFEMASRLNGTTKEEIEKDAESMATLIGQTHKSVAPFKSTEPEVMDEKQKALKELSESLRKK